MLLLLLLLSPQYAMICFPLLFYHLPCHLFLFFFAVNILILTIFFQDYLTNILQVLILSSPYTPLYGLVPIMNLFYTPPIICFQENLHLLPNCPHLLLMIINSSYVHLLLELYEMTSAIQIFLIQTSYLIYPFLHHNLQLLAPSSSPTQPD